MIFWLPWDVESVTLNRIGEKESRPANRAKISGESKRSTGESSMTRQLLPVACAGFMLFLAGSGPAPAAAQAPHALRGRVTAAEQVAMGGVSVSARKGG